MKKWVILAAMALCCLSCGTKDLEEGTPTVPGWGGKEESGTVYDYTSRQIHQPAMSKVDVEHFIVPEPPFEYDVVYEEDKTDFANPERGEYSPIAYNFIGGAVPTEASVATLSKPLKNGVSLIFTIVYLCDFMNERDLSPAVIELMHKHFKNLRQSGCKTILRFAYSFRDAIAEGEPVQVQQEPDVDIVLAHIGQLAPILKEYADVIYILQAGFIGTYGEWATTTNISSEEDRAKVVRALLDAMPENRQVAVRTPMWKWKLLGLYLGRKEAAILADSITVAEAFGTSDKARIALHNDCAFANSTDGGTFIGMSERFYTKNEANYIAYGGESCYMGDDTYCECVPSYSNLKTYRWSYLSNHYIIRDTWERIGCLNDATSRVGYRFILNGARFHGNFGADEDFEISLCLSNYGFASLINERKMKFVIVNADSPVEKYVIPVSKDPRDWKGGRAYVYTERISLPQSLRPGVRYNLYLSLPDMSPNLSGNPSYSVRFANKNVWDPQTGYNLLATFKAE